MANSDILKLSNDGKTVEGVWDESVKSITIPDSVTFICERAFSDCSSLQSINVSKDNKHFASVDGILFNKDLTAIVRFPQKYDVNEYVIPYGVTKIEGCAFDGCSSLQSIDIPNSVTIIGYYAFWGCSFLQRIDIPNCVTVIRYGAFGYCSSLQSIDIPNSVTKIGGAAFASCSSLQTIDIPDSVTYIGESAFHGCSSLQSIDVSNDNMHFASVNGILFNNFLTTIVRFPPKYDVKEYVIPNSVTEIEECAFLGCSSLQSIDIPDSVTEISNRAFSGCSSLQSIVIPNSVTEIGNSAFWRCSSLQSIDIPDSVTKIGDSAFWRCSSLEHIYLHCNYVEKLKVSEYIFYGVDFDKCILHIPSGTRWAYRHHDVFKRFKNIVTTGF